jgi:hypothetical protein
MRMRAGNRRSASVIMTLELAAIGHSLARRRDHAAQIAAIDLHIAVIGQLQVAHLVLGDPLEPGPLEVELKQRVSSRYSRLIRRCPLLIEQQMENRLEVFFGACDHEMEHFMSVNEFKQGLIREILLHGDVVIPDNALYTSNYLETLATPASSRFAQFVGACIRRGAFVPAFRSESGGSFERNLIHIREQGIQGVGENADRMCSFFEGAAKGERLYYRIWPSKPFSVGFKSLIEAMMNDSFITPDSSFRMSRFWDKTKTLREYVLGSIEVDNLGGLRRGTVHNAILKWYSGKATPVGGIEDILREVKMDEIADARRILKWVTYCYQYNQGRMLDTSPGLLSLDSMDHEFVRRIAYLSGNFSNKVITETFRFPSIDAILTVNPEIIFNIRNRGAGNEYFESVQRWQNGPSATAACAVLDTLRVYSREITQAYLEDGRNVINWEWYLKAMLPEGRIREIGTFLIDVTKEVASIPGLGLTSYAAKGASAVYGWLNAHDRTREPVKIGERVQVEIRPDEQSVRDEIRITEDVVFQ